MRRAQVRDDTLLSTVSILFMSSSTYSPWIVTDIDMNVPFFVNQNGDMFVGVAVGRVDAASVSI